MNTSAPKIESITERPKLETTLHVMSNFDGAIDRDVEREIRADATKFGRWSAYNFNAEVWFTDGLFHAEVMRYHVRQGVWTAGTLEELYKTVNDVFGYE